MIKAINSALKSTSFRAEPDVDKKAQEETRILPNTTSTRVRQGFQQTSSAFLDYPVKGFKGDINSNFYEFLTMGIVPYLAGSAMFMMVFNVVDKFLSLPDKVKSRGKNLALGVVLYGIFKSLSKNLVSKPVKAMTGVDVEMPYENIVYPLPKEAGESANIEVQHQQRKVYDSKEFFRKDLLLKQEGYGVEYFDGIAKKLGLGENLNDSVTETVPIIQNIVATSNTAKSLSSYCWAAVGVGLAAQDSWSEFFGAFAKKKKYTANPDASMLSRATGRIKNMSQNTWDVTKAFGNSFLNSCKSLWSGRPGTEGYMKHAGKGLVGLALAMTTVLTANTIIRARNLAKNKNVNTIDKTKETTVI